MQRGLKMSEKGESFAEDDIDAACNEWWVGHRIGMCLHKTRRAIWRAAIEWYTKGKVTEGFQARATAFAKGLVESLQHWERVIVAKAVKAFRYYSASEFSYPITTVEQAVAVLNEREWKGYKWSCQSRDGGRMWVVYMRGQPTGYDTVTVIAVANSLVLGERVTDLEQSDRAQQDLIAGLEAENARLRELAVDLALKLGLDLTVELRRRELEGEDVRDVMDRRLKDGSITNI
jgi:hypothetical protein